MKSTLFRPKKARRAKKHGFRARMENRYGQKVVSRRRSKGRNRLTV